MYSKCVIITQISDILLCCLAGIGCIILYSQEDSSSSLITLQQSITLYFAFSLPGVISIVQASTSSSSSSSSILPRSTDKLGVSLAFFIQFLFSLQTIIHSSQDTTDAALCSFAAVSVCLSTSLLSTFSLASSTRYISSIAMILFTNLQGTFTLHLSNLNSNQKSSVIPIIFCTHVLTLLIIYLFTLVIVQLNRRNVFTNTMQFFKVQKSKHKIASSEKLVNNAHDDTMDTEPINFSFYFKDEISDDIKNVMKTIDEMLINESGKPLDIIEEVSEEVVENRNDENIYVNVNIRKHPLDDSKLEETEIV